MKRLPIAIALVLLMSAGMITREALSMCGAQDQIPSINQ
jgi:hypothetical protein